MSRSTVDEDMLWSTKSLWSASGMWQKPCPIGISGLLFSNTRSWIFCKDRASAKRCRIIRMSFSLSHSSSASTTTTYKDWQLLPCTFGERPKTSCCHWSRSGSETLLIEVFSSNSACNLGVPRAGQAIQPEDTPPILPISPVINLSKEVDPRVDKAGWLVSLCIRVKGRLIGVR